jgi:hypothetical protein
MVPMASSPYIQPMPDPAKVASVRAGHAGTWPVPVVSVTDRNGDVHVFRFPSDGARDLFLLAVVDACAAHHATSVSPLAA